MAWRDWIKTFVSGDKDQTLADEARGSSGAAPIGGGDAGGYDRLQGLLAIDQDLMLRYADYENMDDYPNTTDCLDRAADNSTVPDSIHGKTIWGVSKDRVIRDIVDDCLHRRIKIEEDIWPAIRTLCKYGSLFAEILVNEIGVVGLNWLPSPTMRRIVDEKGSLIGFVQDTAGTFNFDYKVVVDKMKGGGLPEVKDEDEKRKVVFFRPWEVVHWRLRGKNMQSQYGSALFDSARWVWKRLVMMEDMSLVQKLTKSGGRFAFYVDTGDLPPREAMALVKKVKRGFKKTKLIDPATGKLDFKYNVLGPPEDMWIPTRGGKESTRIEVLSGPDVQLMEDIQYFEDKLDRFLKLPKDSNLESDRTLAQKDARFARVCMRIQRDFVTGMRKVLRVHMAALNIDPDSVEWKIRMTIPSAIFEMQQIEVMNAQAALATSMMDFASKPWILEKIFHYTLDDAIAIQRDKDDEQDVDSKRDAGTQADIMRLYPQLQEMPQIGDEPPVAESSMGKELIGLKKVIEESSQSNSEVIKRFKRLESQVSGLEKAIKKRVVTG